jgi:hypothetical protein
VPTPELPSVPGVLTAEQVLATGLAIAAVQQADGAIGWPDGHADAWNHTECVMALSVCGLRDAARRGYSWLEATQQPDGSWPKAMAGGVITDASAESNQAAYPAVGVWHELLVTGDGAFAAAMWPMVRRAITFVIGLQTTRGELAWRRTADGATAGYALLTGCSSAYQSLRCAVALAEFMGEPQPDWELAADLLGQVIAGQPDAFADKSRYSMDWYYPVLGGAVRGQAAADRLAGGWATFVVPGLGVRCVSDEPWVTGAETCELVMALDAIGDRPRAGQLFDQVQHLRDGDGAYWTGWQYTSQAHFPAERSAWTAAAVVLAADVLAGATGGAGIFREIGTAGAGGNGGGAGAGGPSADAGRGPLQHP